MALLAFLLFGLVVTPFFVLGVKRLWLVAAAFWLPVVIYAAYVWTLPFDPTEDVQMAEAWRMILLAVVVMGLAAFVAGMIARQFARRRGVNLEETFE